jgi:UDP-glucose 4-epimerase
LIKVACQAALGQRDYLEVFGTDYPTSDGTCIRDFIHVADLVSAHRRVLDHLRVGGDSVTFNCGYGHGFSVRDVIAAVCAEAGTSFPVRESGRREGDCPTVVADVSRLSNRLGWKPRHDSLREIVGSAYAWEKRLAEREEALDDGEPTARRDHLSSETRPNE